MSKKSNLFKTLPAIIISTLLVVLVIYGWTEPSSAPPAGNVPAPINVSDAAQIKTGPLQVNGFRNIGNTILDGNVGIGTTTPQAKLDVAGGIRIGSYAVKPACNANVIGMLVFDTANDQPYVCASTGWNPLDSKANPFGNGSDGDVVLSADTNLTAVSGTDVETGIKQYNNLTINAGVKLSVASGHVLKFKVKDTLIINGEINVDRKGGAGATTAGTAGEAGDVADLVTGGEGGICYGCWGGGIGCIIGSPSPGKAGSGGGGAAIACANGAQGGSNGGKTAVSALGIFRIGGNGGGGGGVCGHGIGGAGGGKGGGVIMISAKNVVLNENIYARGESGGHTGSSGVAGHGGSGGGGAGGIIILEYQSKTGSGTINVSGGAGGTIYGGGAYSTTDGSAPGGAGSKGIVILRKY